MCIVEGRVVFSNIIMRAVTTFFKKIILPATIKFAQYSCKIQDTLVGFYQFWNISTDFHKSPIKFYGNSPSMSGADT
jgi:hypothetical protein